MPTSAPLLEHFVGDLTPGLRLVVVEGVYQRVLLAIRLIQSATEAGVKTSIIITHDDDGVLPQIWTTLGRRHIPGVEYFAPYDTHTLAQSLHAAQDRSQLVLLDRVRGWACGEALRRAQAIYNYTTLAIDSRTPPRIVNYMARSVFAAEEFEDGSLHVTDVKNRDRAVMGRSEVFPDWKPR